MFCNFHKLAGGPQTQTLLDGDPQTQFTLSVAVTGLNVPHNFYLTHKFNFMAFDNIGAYACQNLQVDLVSYFGKNAPEFRTLGSTSLLKWLLSPQNTSSFVPINPGAKIPGKKRGVAFRVNSPYCFEVARAAANCAVQRTYISPGIQEIVFDMDAEPFRYVDGDGVPTKLKFDLEALMANCTVDDMSWAQDQIHAYLMAFEKAMDKKISAELVASVPGAWNKNVPLFVKNNQTGGSVLNPEGMWYLNQLYSDIGMDGNYGVIGGAIVNKMAQFKAWLCCNNAGVDMSKQDAATPWAFYDRNLDAIIGNNELIMAAPGTAQLVTWNKYTGSMKREVTNLYTHGTIVMPTTGITLDYEWTYDYNCKIWYFEAFSYTELAVVPAGGCGDAVGANGLLRITDCGLTDVVPACPAP